MPLRLRSPGSLLVFREVIDRGEKGESCGGQAEGHEEQRIAHSRIPERGVQMVVQHADQQRSHDLTEEAGCEHQHRDGDRSHADAGGAHRSGENGCLMRQGEEAHQSESDHPGCASVAEEEDYRITMHSGGRSRNGLSVWKCSNEGTTPSGSSASRLTSCMSLWPA